MEGRLGIVRPVIASGIEQRTTRCQRLYFGADKTAADTEIRPRIRPTQTQYMAQFV